MGEVSLSLSTCDANASSRPSVSNPALERRKSCAPRFEVITTIEFVKSARRPRPSVSRPSPSICNKRSKNDESAFSNSSKSNTENGCSRMRAVNVPSPPVNPPTRRVTAVASAYSLMSKRAIRRSSPKKNRARDLAISVLPVPVGPVKRSDAIGLRGRVKPALVVARSSTINFTAALCPITRSSNHLVVRSTSKLTSSSSRNDGKPVSFANAAVTSATLISGDCSAK